jgi:hypothetical protein
MLIKYNKNNVHALGSFDGKTINWLSPGWNEFPSDIWKIYENDKEIQRMLADKQIELLEEKIITGKGKNKTVEIIGKSDEELHLSKLPEAKAIELIKGTLNRKMLERWIDEEVRHKVKRALVEQLKPLLPEEEKQD